MLWRKSMGILAGMTFAISLAATAGNPPAQKLTAAEIADKNAAARGGVQAWRSVQTISFEGKMGAGGNQRATLQPPVSSKSTQQLVPERPAEEVQLPFVMQLKRPRKERLELQFNGQTAVQVYDGTNGWKVRPFLNRNDVEPFSSDELKMASAQADLDGYLIDCAAKGTRIELDGVEKIEEHDNYKLKLTLKSGQQLHVWVDAQTFLETKVEGQPRRLDGSDHPVEVYYRDYRPVSGIVVPFMLETRVLPVTRTATGLKDTPVPAEKTMFNKVVVNATLDDSRFQKPVVAAAPNARPAVSPTPTKN